MPLIRVYRAFMVGRWRWHVFLRNTCSLYLIDWWDLSIEWWYNEKMQYTISIGKDWTINQTNWFHQWISTVSWDFPNLGGTPRPILQSSNTVDICLNVKKLLGPLWIFKLNVWSVGGMTHHGICGTKASSIFLLRRFPIRAGGLWSLLWW